METLKAKFLVGKQLYLRPVEKDDLDQFYAWFNDPFIRGLTGEVFPTSRAGMDEFMARLQTDTGRVWFAIVLHENDRLIGEAGLLRIFPAWRTTDLSVIIADQAAWGQGYGTEAMGLLSDYAFGHLNYHRIAIGVVGSNSRALRFYEKLGFKHEGLQRDGYYYDHHYEDFVMMSMLENEYREHNEKGIPD